MNDIFIRLTAPGSWLIRFGETFMGDTATTSTTSKNTIADFMTWLVEN